MNLIKIKTNFAINDQDQMDKLDRLGIPYEIELETLEMYINVDAITTINKATSGNTVIGYGEDRWEILVVYEDFINFIEKIATIKEF